MIRTVPSRVDLRALLVVLGTTAAACGPEPEPPPHETVQQAAKPAPFDDHRSLIITDTAILEPTFSFAAVMSQITSTAGLSTVTPLALFQQWWATQNAGPGSGPRCDDELTDGAPSHNGFPFACPRAEGAQATVDPFTGTTPSNYIPIALTNRFDLAPADGSHCGEYRVVFAKRSGVTSTSDRNLVIFEAVLPNPSPRCGLAACRPVAQFWRDLSAVTKVADRRERLRKFYFEGLPGFRPVIHAHHYGARLTSGGYGVGSGQIRSNAFMQSPWMLREWRLVKDCRCLPCKLTMVPVTVKTNPAGLLFDARSTEPRAASFRADFLGQVKNLAATSLLSMFVEVADRYNGGQSIASSTIVDNDYGVHLDAGAVTDPSFRDAIAAELTAIGSPLSPRNIVDRATAASCAGCHRLSNGDALGGGLVWPPSLGFVHVGENGGPTETGPNGPRWPISTALRGTFLPHRRQVLLNFLSSSSGTCSSTPLASTAGTAQLIGGGVVISVPSDQISDAELTDLGAGTSVAVLEPILCTSGTTTTAEDLAVVDAVSAKAAAPVGGNLVH